MGYACPVCETPQLDAGHLANHLAFTAILGDAAHEDWLDEHAPGWAEAGEDALAERVVAHAPEREFPQVFEDTVGDPPAEGSQPPHRGMTSPERAPDETVDSVLAEARELTERRRAAAEEADGDDADGNG